VLRHWGRPGGAIGYRGGQNEWYVRTRNPGIRNKEYARRPPSHLAFGVRCLKLWKFSRNFAHINPQTGKRQGGNGKSAAKRIHSRTGHEWGGWEGRHDTTGHRGAHVLDQDQAHQAVVQFAMRGAAAAAAAQCSAAQRLRARRAGRVLAALIAGQWVECTPVCRDDCLNGDPMLRGCKTASRDGRSHRSHRTPTRPSFGVTPTGSQRVRRRPRGEGEGGMPVRIAIGPRTRQKKHG